jgi:hypothetical protein
MNVLVLPCAGVILEPVVAGAILMVWELPYVFMISEVVMEMERVMVNVLGQL